MWISNPWLCIFHIIISIHFNLKLNWDQDPNHKTLQAIEHSATACLLLLSTHVFPPPCLVISYINIIPLTCSLGCFTKHFIEKIGYKMVLRQPTSRQQVGTLYEMLLRRRRVCKNTQRDIGQQPSLSAFPPARAAEPRLDKRQRAEVSAGSVETQRGKGRHNVRKSVGKMKNVTFMVCKQEKIAFVP